ncbi:MAG: NADH:flavin oxidoreductase, partial [Clostridiales bacterium]|nr:NADH:flavin oxidoreductase [Clostridiales bacterium]
MNEKNRKLFEPTKIGSMRLQNRFVMAPMTTNANPNHVIDDGMIDYYEEIAKGGVGMIVCDTQIVSNKIDPWYEAVTIIGTNEQKVRFMALTERLKGYGTKLCVQLTIGPGRNAFPIPGKASVSASAIPGLYDPSQNTRALTLEEVESIPRAFADVALMAKEAGFDAAEVHAHTGYLLDQFISKNWNKRTDKYGGSLENRLRLLTEILQAIKEKAGQAFPVFIRVSGQHHFPGGRTLDTFPEIIRKLDEAGYDGFDVDSGSYEAIEWIFPPS